MDVGSTWDGGTPILHLDFHYYGHCVIILQWGRGCYARNDTFPPSCVASLNPDAPCYSAPEADCTSAVAFAYNTTATVYARRFARLNVTLDIDRYTATLAWL